MRRLTFCVVFAVGVLLSMPGWAASPPPDMETALLQAAATVCDPPYGCAVTEFQRQELVNGVVHYSAVLQVGPGMYERIGLHRVVLENSLGHPIKLNDRIFLQHGDLKNFVGMFLPALYSPAVSPDFGFALYLAQNRVDVWGIDQSWAMLPDGIVEFSFMKDWGMQYQVDDLHSGLAVAREVRRLMGGSGDRFNLLGYSSGGMTGYALLNYEASLPKKERHVQGYIAAEISFKSSDEDWSAVGCDTVPYYEAQYDAGVYGDQFPFTLAGTLARDLPDGDSPIFPGFTNLQAALALGTFPLFGETPVHYLAGEFDALGLPTGLQYMPTEAWLDFMINGFDWEPTLFYLDFYRILCGSFDMPFDDYLSEVTVPVYNWGTAGGVGPYGVETFDWLGSKDTTSLIVSTRPPEEILLDFAHVDLFAAHNAPELAWQPLLDWLRAHR